MTVPYYEYRVTIYLNNALAQGGEYQKYAYISAPTDRKAMMIARKMFEKIDYEYMSASKNPNDEVFLWDRDKVNELND